MRSLAWTLSLVALLAPTVSFAQEAPPDGVVDRTASFGRAGTTVISGAFGLDVSARIYDDSNVHSTTVALSPGVDRFVVDHLSVGAGIDIDWSKSQGYGTHGAIDRYTQTFYGINARVAYDVPLGRFVSWWPRLGLGYSHTDNVTESSEKPRGYDGDLSDLGGLRWEYKESGAYVYAFAPLLVHPIPHWYFGFGPYVYRDLGRSRENQFPAHNDRTTVSFYLTTGVSF